MDLQLQFYEGVRVGGGPGSGSSHVPEFNAPDSVTTHNGRERPAAVAAAAAATTPTRAEHRARRDRPGTAMQGGRTETQSASKRRPRWIECNSTTPRVAKLVESAQRALSSMCAMSIMSIICIPRSHIAVINHTSTKPPEEGVQWMLQIIKNYHIRRSCLPNPCLYPLQPVCELHH